MGSYDAYLIPEGVKEYYYTRDGKEIQGFQYQLKLEFPQGKQESRKRPNTPYQADGAFGSRGIRQISI